VRAAFPQKSLSHCQPGIFAQINARSTDKASHSFYYALFLNKNTAMTLKMKVVVFNGHSTLLQSTKIMKTKFTKKLF